MPCFSRATVGKTGPFDLPGILIRRQLPRQSQKRKVLPKPCPWSLLRWKSESAGHWRLRGAQTIELQFFNAFMHERRVACTDRFYALVFQPSVTIFVSQEMASGNHLVD